MTSMSGGSQEPVKTGEPPVNLLFFDGVRGVAILAVISFHLMLYSGTRSDRSGFAAADSFTSYGYLGVALFIVVSGFVLMYPMARNRDLTFPRGIGNFYFRRARRILPPYLIALTLSLVLIWIAPDLQSPSDTAWDTKIPVTPGGITSHFLLIQDISPLWVNQINGPLWSVAVEVHLYLLMPIVLIPMWRKFNPFWIVGWLTVGGVAFSVLDLATWAHPWLIALFAAGMLASQIATGLFEVPRLKLLTIAAAATLVLLFVVFRQQFTREVAVSEILSGLVFAAACALCAKAVLERRTNTLVRVLSSEPLVYLGCRSYSIYLLHSPLLAVGNLLLLRGDYDPSVHLILMITCVAPVTLVACLVYFHLVERRFTTTHQRFIAH